MSLSARAPLLRSSYLPSCLPGLSFRNLDRCLTPSRLPTCQSTHNHHLLRQQGPPKPLRLAEALQRRASGNHAHGGVFLPALHLQSISRRVPVKRYVQCADPTDFTSQLGYVSRMPTLFEQLTDEEEVVAVRGTVPENFPHMRCIMSTTTLVLPQGLGTGEGGPWLGTHHVR